MRKIILVLVLVSFSFGDFLNVPLKEYISFVSRTNQINIIYNNNRFSNVSVYISKDLNKTDYFDILESLLDDRGYLIEPKGSFFLIKRKKRVKNNIKKKSNVIVEN